MNGIVIGMIISWQTINTAGGGGYLPFHPFEITFTTESTQVEPFMVGEWSVRPQGGAAFVGEGALNLDTGVSGPIVLRNTNTGMRGHFQLGIFPNGNGTWFLDLPGTWSAGGLLGLPDVEFLTKEPPVEPGCNSCADFDDSGDVGFTDLTFLLGNWGGPDADLDCDKTTGFTDLTILLGQWGTSCP